MVKMGFSHATIQTQTKTKLLNYHQVFFSLRIHHKHHALHFQTHLLRCSEKTSADRAFHLPFNNEHLTITRRAEKWSSTILSDTRGPQKTEPDWLNIAN